MKKRIIAVAAALCLLLSIPVFASSFTDVTETSHPWAIDEIEEMTVLGIIKGYTDRTFKPDKDITKTEALILTARIAGYTLKDYASFINYANLMYAAALDGYVSDYKNEIAFLLYKGVLSPDELDYYIGGGNATQPLKRYEAAVLLTKLMGQEEAVKDSVVSILGYSDLEDIPTSARGYVEYVTNDEIMVGMSQTEFKPNVNVTRAQVAVLLYRVMNKINLTVEAGIVTNIDASLDVLKLRNADGGTNGYSIGDDAVIKVDGHKSEFSDIKAGSEAAIIRRNGAIYEVESINEIYDDTFTGKVVSITTSGAARISVQTPDESETRELFFADTPTVTFDGQGSALSQIKKGDYVTLEISGLKVTAVRAQSKSRTVSGVVKGISADDDYSVITVLDDEGNLIDYQTEDSPGVKRNGQAALLLDILVGDKVSLTLTYGLVSSLTATSVKSSDSGIIEAINISSQPSITVKSGGQSLAYLLSLDAKYTVEGEAATLYDLRVGMSVSLTVEGGTATAVSSKTSASSGTFTGTVKSINISYYSFTLQIKDAATGEISTQQIFAARSGTTVSAKIYDAAGKSLAFKNLKEGDSVFVSGSVSGGIFEAKTILVLSE